MPYYTTCPNCKAPRPTDSFMDYISYDELNFCYFCGTKIEEKVS